MDIYSIPLPEALLFVCLFQLPDVKLKSDHSPWSPSDVEEQMLKTAIAESVKDAAE